MEEKKTFYGLAEKKDREAIIDFANYVFSQAHCPHDFKTLLPKAYGDEAEDFTSWHYVAKQEGRIRAMVAVRLMQLKVFDHTLSAGFIGTVSVHPYARGEGHMKHLMRLAEEDSRAKDYDLLILGGQRQRYNYFGFEKAGVALTFEVNAANCRHALKTADISGITLKTLTEADEKELDFCWTLSQRLPVRDARPRERYLDIMRSWQNPLKLILSGGEPIGYVSGRDMEIALTEESFFPAVLKALVQEAGEALTITAAPWEKERISFLHSVCEDVTIGNMEMIKILHYPRTLEALLSAQRHVRPLEDGQVLMRPAGQEAFAISVQNGVPSVCPVSAPDVPETDPLALVQTLFGLPTALTENGLPSSWTPLPFYLTRVDTF